MKKLRSILALLLVAATLLSFSMVALAADETEEPEAADAVEVEDTAEVEEVADAAAEAEDPPAGAPAGDPPAGFDPAGAPPAEENTDADAEVIEGGTDTYYVEVPIYIQATVNGKTVVLNLDEYLVTDNDGNPTGVVCKGAPDGGWLISDVYENGAKTQKQKSLWLDPVHNWYETVEATCVDKGKQICLDCGIEQTVKALGHKWSSEGGKENWGIVVEGYDCTKGGIAQDYCERCGVMGTKTRTVYPSAHNFQFVVDQKPECYLNPKTKQVEIKDGWGHFECAYCQYWPDYGNKDNPGYAASGEPAQDAFEVRDEDDPDAEENWGIAIDYDTYMAMFGAQDRGYDGHDWSDWSRDVEPTCTTYGVEHRVCVRCWTNQERVVSPLLHNDGEAIKYEGEHLATCFKAYYIYKCDLCGARFIGKGFSSGSHNLTINSANALQLVMKAADYEAMMKLYDGAQNAVDGYSASMMRQYFNFWGNNVQPLDDAFYAAGGWDAFAKTALGDSLYHDVIAHVYLHGKNDEYKPSEWNKNQPYILKDADGNAIMAVFKDKKAAQDYAKKNKACTYTVNGVEIEIGYGKLWYCSYDDGDPKGVDHPIEFEPEGVLDHDWTEFKLMNSAYKDGVEYKHWLRTCKRCGAIDDFDGTYNPTPCKEGEHTYEVMYGDEADCIFTGTRVSICSKCGDVKEEEVQATGHVWGNALHVSLPDCATGTDGQDVYICSKCDAVKYETVKAEHKVVDMPKIDATTEADGREAGKQCEVCKTWIEGGQKIDKIVPNTYSADVTGVSIRNNQVNGSVKVTQTGGNQPKDALYARVVTNFEHDDGCTYFVAVVVPVVDGVAEMPVFSEGDTITGVSVMIVNDKNVSSSWAGHNVTNPVVV